MNNNQIRAEHAEDDRRDYEKSLHNEGQCAICDEEFGVQDPKWCTGCDANVCSRCWSVTYACCSDCAKAHWKDLRTEIIKAFTESEYNHCFIGEEAGQDGGHILEFEAHCGPDIKVVISEKWDV